MVVHPEGSQVWQMEQLLMEAAQKTHVVTPESLRGVSGTSVLLQWGGRCSFGLPGARERAGDRELACGNVRKESSDSAGFTACLIEREGSSGVNALR